MKPYDDPFTATETKEILLQLAELVIGRIQKSTREIVFEPTIFEPLAFRIFRESCDALKPTNSKLTPVLAIQVRLNLLGYSEVGEIDGLYGPKTEQAVKAFQQINNLEVDGVVGPNTWEILFSTNAISKQ